MSESKKNMERTGAGGHEPERSRGPKTWGDDPSPAPGGRAVRLLRRRRPKARGTIGAALLALLLLVLVLGGICTALWVHVEGPEEWEPLATIILVAGPLVLPAVLRMASGGRRVPARVRVRKRR